MDGWFQEAGKAISAAFRPSPLEIFLTLFFVLLFVFFMVFFFVYQRRREKEALRELEQDRFVDLVEKYQLTTEEIRLVNRLADYLPPGQERFRLLSSRDAYRTAEELMLRDETDPPVQALASLSLRIGFGGYQEGREIRSTTEIPPNTTVFVHRDDTPSLEATVVTVTPEALVIRLIRGTLRVRPGMTVNLHFTMPEGRYRLRSRVSAVTANVIRLFHSEVDRHIQERSFYRFPAVMPASIRPAGSGDDARPTRILEISGGGCSLLNPSGLYRRGDRVELFLGDRQQFQLEAEVVRTSGEHRTIHLAFAIQREPVRDRLVRYIREAS